MLWFGDERGYNATLIQAKDLRVALWFGDERGYNATTFLERIGYAELWFGDERGYNATYKQMHRIRQGCGLVMKEDITQRRCQRCAGLLGCGLVMKEDITQHTWRSRPT